ncbi:ATP-binding protein [Neobacillus sp. MM2021_6]|uniref:DnaA ATPase domain-containing protein n=1 Tax=Bacillaceae TaxID=186817 RepID=UPI001409F715|nr:MULTISPECIES: DnaA/Hda family protein [Bacillaceae]MBO0959537.1 ATP-binding protein [Neobacillus sp. MM2021_6]NHC17165.1 ATP-binding protein [Bacillus sp. MM2020_4]
MKPISTLISSRLKIIGQRICDDCGVSVPIIERNGKEVSVCLNCENLALKSEMEDFRDKSLAEAFFYNNSLVPSDTEDCRFDNYQPKSESQQDALTKAKWYADNFRAIVADGKWNSLLFQGDYGIGKSHLSHSIAMVLKEKRFKVIFSDTPMLMKKIQSTYGNHKESEMTIFKNIQEADLLILDDLGAEYVKSKNGEESWSVDTLFSIIGSRVDKPNIYTTNYDSEGLAKKYGTHGGRIVSRMMKGTKPIKMIGEDFRTKGW